MKKKLAKVTQLENKNQFVIETEKDLYFQSYDSVCARYNKDNNFLYLNKDWDYSNTTRKHLYIFITEWCNLAALEDAILYAKSKRAEIKKMIKNRVIRIDKNLD